MVAKSDCVNLLLIFQLHVERDLFRQIRVVNVVDKKKLVHLSLPSLFYLNEYF
jgi:hypothetical protein